MDSITQHNLVDSHIAALEAEAAAERLAHVARATEPRQSLRAALGRRLIAVGTAIAAAPVDEPCPDTSIAHPA